jgi:hypothetical protein
MPGTLDRRIASLILLCARRTWPPLTVVPASWIRPLLVPMAVRLRRSLTRAVLAVSLATGATVALLAALR